ncbi:NAD(P)/FAD-dependent oxidoreductase [Paracidovorax konjaci]|uniref:NADH dehydrogenase n=1 Tax=Paracidovorax konjaci TaxID=32040 RepID=A0A1I1TRT4_9BURK|nr:NAD(P)/FAD-dependent oxidoreductase [Paracidovorax konjaci]SFD61272.1 NADH dehydrogenase [Paracidovorax konjaci]
MNDAQYPHKSPLYPSRPIVVVGGGVAGLEIATELGRLHRREPLLHPPVKLIDRDFAHVWKPMLHTIAAGTRDVHQQQTPFIAQASAAGFSFEPGELCGLNRKSRAIFLAPYKAPDGRVLVPARRVTYTALIIAVGSQANDFGTPGVAEHCHTIDSRSQAEAFSAEIRIRILQCLAEEELEGITQDLSIAIVGGGATGVELAAELIGLADAAEAYGGHGLRSCIHITLIDSGTRLLSAFPQNISDAVQKRLENLGVRVLKNVRVAAATTHGFTLGDGREVSASLRVWAAGVKAPEFLGTLDGLQTTRTNQLVVRPNLQTTLDPNVYAVGDCANLQYEGEERPLPPTAQVAHQQAQHLIRHLPEFFRRDVPVPDFRHRDFGSLVSLSEYDAYGSLGKTGLLKGTTFKGWLAQFSHVLLYRSHQARLHGFWRGGMLWLVDLVNARLRSKIRLD